MLYRLCTNTNASRLNIRLGLIDGTHADIKLDQYEWLAEEDDASSPPAGVACYLLKRSADTSELAADMRLFRSGGKMPDPKKIPDFWSTSNLPTVSEAFKNLMEEIDPGVHQFFPINLIIDKTNEPVDHTRFYHFICGRLVDVPVHDQPCDRSTHDTRSIDEGELHRWRTIQERPDIQTYLDQLPIWRFRDLGRFVYFINKESLDITHERGLKGFKESSGHVNRDVQHVRY